MPGVLSLGFFALVASSLGLAAPTPADSFPSVQFDGRSFVPKGLVAFGSIPSDAVDSFGETIGGVGSSIALESFSSSATGFKGLIRLQPDRGHNTQTTTDYRARSHTFKFAFSPVSTNATAASPKNFNLQYLRSTLYRTSNSLLSLGNYTTGLDPDGVRNGRPPLPIALSDNHVSVDAEGLAFTKDGLYQFVSDEYGPYVYKVETLTGKVVDTLAPPSAIVPSIGGKANFTSLSNPDTGRAPNQGFEGLTLDTEKNVLWALLQSATIQDSQGGSKTTNRYSRLVGWNVGPFQKPAVVHEYVVPLPQSKKGKTMASSQLHIVDPSTFLVLARDGNGFGDTDSGSSYKSVDLISIKNATDIANTKFDSASTPVAPNGVLDSSVQPAAYQTFNSLIDSTQLAKFGLHVGGAFDSSLIASKLESLALAPAKDRSNPDDYFLFVVSDNDFITTNGTQAAQVSDGSYQLQKYSDPYPYGSQDTQVFVYLVTLPGASKAASAIPFF